MSSPIGGLWRAHSMGEMPMDMSAIVVLVASRVSGGLMLVVGLVIALGEISGS